MHINDKDSPQNCLQSTSLLLSKIYVFTTVTLQCIHARLYRIWPPLSLNDSRMTGRNVNMTWSSRIWTSMTIRDMSVFKNAQPICIINNLSWPHCLLVMINWSCLKLLECSRSQILVFKKHRRLNDGRSLRRRKRLLLHCVDTVRYILVQHLLELSHDSRSR